MKQLIQIVLLLTIFHFGATAQNYPNYNIIQISNINANGDADSVNVQCSVSGTVFTPNYTNTGVEFFIHDHTGGLLISDPTNMMFAVQRTDSVQVFGTLSQTSGMLRMDADSIVVISTGNTETTVTSVTTLTEADESELVQLTGLTMTTPGQWLGNGSTFFVNTTDGTNQFIIIIKENTPMSNTPAPTGPFDVIGAVAQEDITIPYLQRYEIWPRDLSDFNFLPALPEIDFDGANLQVDEASGTTTVTMRLDQVTTTHDTLVITTAGAGNTATDALDYIITPASTNNTFTLTLAPGDTTVSFDVAIIDDLIVEGNENIRFTVASNTLGITVAAGGGGGPGGGAANYRITILDNEVVPIIDFVGPNIQVDEASGTATITLSLDIPAMAFDTVTVGFAGGNTADEGLDYTITPAFINDEIAFAFAPGDTSASFDVNIIDDGILEGDETIRFTVVATTDSIQVATGGGPGGGGANYTITILDNEIIPTVDFEGPNIQVDEGSGTAIVTLSLDIPALTYDTVTVGIAGGNADEGLDFTTTPIFVNDENKFSICSW